MSEEVAKGAGRVDMDALQTLPKPEANSSGYALGYPPIPEIDKSHTIGTQNRWKRVPARGQRKAYRNPPQFEVN